MLEKIVAAHARLARHAGRYDHNIGAGNRAVIVRPGKMCGEALLGGRLVEVERFALRDTLGDVEQDDITQFFKCRNVGQRSADLPSTNQCDLPASHFASLTSALRRTALVRVTAGSRQSRWQKQVSHALAFRLSLTFVAKLSTRAENSQYSIY